MLASLSIYLPGPFFMASSRQRAPMPETPLTLKLSGSMNKPMDQFFMLPPFKAANTHAQLFRGK